MIPGVQVFVYPEELEATPPDALARQIVALGCDGVSIAVVYHRARRVFPRQRRVSVLPDTMAYVEPVRERYGRLAPRRTPAAGLPDAVRQFRDACDGAGLRFRAWIVALHDERLAFGYPELAAQTVDGSLLGHSLCPSTTEAREYVAALAGDVAAQLRPDAVDLEAALYPAWEPSYTLTLALEPLPELACVLATQCFCTACRELLGPGADELRVRALAGDDGVVDELARGRARGAAALVDQVADAVHAAGSELRVFAGGPPEQATIQGVSPASVARADALLLGCGPLRGAELDARFAGLRALVGGRRASVSTNWTPERTQADWSDDVARLARAGAEGLALYNLTLVPESGLDALRAAADAFRAASA